MSKVKITQYALTEELAPLVCPVLEPYLPVFYENPYRLCWIIESADRGARAGGLSSHLPTITTPSRFYTNLYQIRTKFTDNTLDFTRAVAPHHPLTILCKSIANSEQSHPHFTTFFCYRTPTFNNFFPTGRRAVAPPGLSWRYR